MDVLQEVEDEFPGTRVFSITNSLCEESLYFLLILRLVHKNKAAQHHWKNKQNNKQVSSFKNVMLVLQMEILTVWLEESSISHWRYLVSVNHTEFQHDQWIECYITHEENHFIVKNERKRDPNEMNETMRTMVHVHDPYHIDPCKPDHKCWDILCFIISRHCEPIKLSIKSTFRLFLITFLLSKKFFILSDLLDLFLLFVNLFQLLFKLFISTLQNCCQIIDTRIYRLSLSKVFLHSVIETDIFLHVLCLVPDLKPFTSLPSLNAEDT